jgi:hypothetical protein
MSRDVRNPLGALVLPRVTPLNPLVFIGRKFPESSVEPGSSKPDEIGKRIAG